jgi:hypothetical protein
MAIIKYQLDTGRIPAYITDGGYFPVGNDLIGIGSGGGTVLSKSELLSYVMADHNSSTYQKIASVMPTRQADMSDSEVTTMVNNWCTAKGIS